VRLDRTVGADKGDKKAFAFFNKKPPELVLSLPHGEKGTARKTFPSPVTCFQAGHFAAMRN
jgi:hypothetical protein